MRSNNQKLIKKLDAISIQINSLDFWEEFYEYIVMSYKEEFEDRLSISDLYYELKRRGIDDASEMIRIYGHSMYVLAKYDNKRIYGEDFNA